MNRTLRTVLTVASVLAAAAVQTVADETVRGIATGILVMLAAIGIIPPQMTTQRMPASGRIIAYGFRGKDGQRGSATIPVIAGLLLAALIFVIIGLDAGAPNDAHADASACAMQTTTTPTCGTVYIRSLVGGKTLIFPRVTRKEFEYAVRQRMIRRGDTVVPLAGYVFEFITAKAWLPTDLPITVVTPTPTPG